MKGESVTFGRQLMSIERFLDTAGQCGCEILMNEPLSGHTTFKLGGPCKAFINIDSTESLSLLLKTAKAENVRTFVLGKGSNVLFDDRGFNGAVLHIGSKMSGIRLENDTTVTAQAGCSLMKLCRFAAEHSLSGLEFAYGIPGTVGGAVYMDAGAYGGEIKDVIKSCVAVDHDGELQMLTAQQLNMSYRYSSVQKTGSVVCEATFELQKGRRDHIEDKMSELMGKRRDKQPLEYPNAGSTFKRPEGFFAGKLIQDSGLRGFTVGGAKVSEKHCGFVINADNATSADVVALIEQVKKIVLEKTGQLLECEVRIVPYEEV